MYLWFKFALCEEILELSKGDRGNPNAVVMWSLLRVYLMVLFHCLVWLALNGMARF